MSLLSHVTDSNGNKLTKRETTRTTKEPTEVQEIIKRDALKLIAKRVKSDGVKVNGTITQLKTRNTKQMNDEFVLMSDVKKAQKVGKNTVGIPFFTEYRIKVFVEETNICEEYTEVLDNGDEVKHVAKDEIKDK
tara:strand:- start:92 stop:493 length:402 start_codon:yes stop_codon:yes gene_type:complete